MMSMKKRRKGEERKNEETPLKSHHLMNLD